jgi:hypothetical protein
MQNEVDYKKIEYSLFNYREIPLYIKYLEIEIERIENNCEGFKGQSDNQIKPSTPTNEFNSSVENELINKEREIERIRNKIKEYELNKKTIEVALESLNDYDLKLITDRYFNKVPASRMAIKYNYTRDWIYKLCKEIITSKLSKYLIGI